MKALSLLNVFFHAIAADPRISITHIGVYAALLQYWQDHDCQHPLQAYSHDIMRLAKISAGGTFHKVIKDLNAYGYVRYIPSYNRKKGSEIYLWELVESHPMTTINHVL